MAESFGIMDQGYFVSRKEILHWVNSILSVEITQIEQLGSGSVYCQLMDAFCPGTAPFHKINWKARHQYEFIQNFKTLQSIFDRLGISKKIEVERLAKCKYQDNLEFIQWVKRYIELQGGCSVGYNGPARRSFVQIDLSFSEKKIANMALNKENFKKHSINNSLYMSTNFKRDYPQTIIKTPSSRRTISSLFGGSNRSRVKTEPAQDQKIDRIKDILKCSQVDSDSQLQKIRQLLHVQQIHEEEQPDII